ncbi:hypothetical protein [Breznakiella homolactica]|uniref:Uncharacterized protein n=1 Tax=Breznakiella homolactica TaxID=2798577 RepID=A0A7T8BBP8_9SPIR|nr:hypothetical protein [Breznakiella homolactica]QQO10295.1 hypothetical protein JFL75_05075 [Breznakiella homolactica]
MAVDPVGDIVGITVPPPEPEEPPVVVDNTEYTEPVPEEAPLPDYEGNTVDESV